MQEEEIQGVISVKLLTGKTWKMHFWILNVFPDVAAVWVRFDSSHWVIHKGAQVLKFKPRCNLKQNLSVFRRKILDEAFSSLIFLVFFLFCWLRENSHKTALTSCTTLFCCIFPMLTVRSFLCQYFGETCFNSAVVKALPPLSSTRREYEWGLSPLSVFLFVSNPLTLSSCFPKKEMFSH